MYQLFAYGQKYLEGNGKMFLIYPESEKFKKPLLVFVFDKKLSLWAVPFKWGDSSSEGLVCFNSIDQQCSGFDWLIHSGDQ